jgi:hypothetical protein
MRPLRTVAVTGVLGVSTVVSLRRHGPACCTGTVTTCSSPARAFCVCLLAMDQLSVDDRRCRRAAPPR